MLFLILTACFLVVAHAGCPMRPTVEQTSASRTAGDGGYKILISGQTNGYVPNAVHTISLQGDVPKRLISELVKLVKEKSFYQPCQASVANDVTL